jgi:hypothetical protein
MDKKYLGTNVALPKDMLEDFERVRTRLKEVLGFVPSRSGAIAFLAHYWEQENPVET